MHIQIKSKQIIYSLKGTVARDFKSTPYSPRIHTLKYFWILFWIHRNIRFLMLFRRFDTPQDFDLQGLIPRRTLLSGVSDPAGHCSAGYQTPQVSDPAGKLRPHRTRRKSFESLPFSLKGQFSRIGCMYKLYYPRQIGFMLKEPPIWTFFCVLRGVLIPRRTTLKLEYLISPRIRTRIWKCFGVWIRGPYVVDSWKKPGAKNLVLLYL